MNDIPLVDRLDIQALVAEYSFRCDTKSFDAIHELFAEDCEFDETVLGMPVAIGRDGVRRYFSAFGSPDTPVEWFMHFNGNQRFTAFDGDTASGTSHLHAEGHLKSGGPARILGYMADDYVKVAGIWRFRKRVLVAIAPVIGF